MTLVRIAGLIASTTLFTACSGTPWMPAKTPTAAAYDESAPQWAGPLVLEATTDREVASLAEALELAPDDTERLDARATVLVDALVTYVVLETAGAATRDVDRVGDWILALAPAAADGGLEDAWAQAAADAAAAGWGSERLAAVAAWTDGEPATWEPTGDPWIDDRSSLLAWYEVVPALRAWRLDAENVAPLAERCGHHCGLAGLTSMAEVAALAPSACAEGEDCTARSDAALCAEWVLSRVRSWSTALGDVVADPDGDWQIVAAYVGDVPTEVQAWQVILPVDGETVFDDIRLDLPLARLTTTADAGVFTAPLASQVVMVRSDAIAMATLPTVSASEVQEAATEYTLPGVDVLAFDGPSRLGVDAIDEAMELTAVREGAVSAPFDLDAPLSVLIDRGTFFGTLDPALRSLASAGATRLVFHAEDADGELLALPIITATATTEANLLVVRSDGYVVEPYDVDAMATPEIFSRAGGQPLAALHNYLATAFVDGVLDPEFGLHVRIDDGSTDYGILVNLLSAILYARDGEAFETDLAVLSAPVVVNAGTPVPLVPGGVTLQLGE